MFIGHFGVGFGAKKAAPHVSLGTLFLAAQFIDLLWPTLLLLGIEDVAIDRAPGRAVPLDFTDYPISHSLLMVLVWALLFALTYWLLRRKRKAAIVLALCLISHWVLDLIVHVPDLPLFPGNSPLLGFGLWNFLPAAAILEIAIFIMGVVLYVRETTPRNGIGKYGLWVLVGLLALAYIANLTAPPPPNVSMIAWAGQLQWLFVLLAYWVDRNRVPPIVKIEGAFSHAPAGS